MQSKILFESLSYPALEAIAADLHKKGGNRTPDELSTLVDALKVIKKKNSAGFPVSVQVETMLRLYGANFCMELL